MHQSHHVWIIAMLYFLICQKKRIARLQYVQNSAARVLCTPLLHDLHWLCHHVYIKRSRLTFKALNGPAPPYLSDLLYSCPARSLGSSELALSSVPRYRLYTAGRSVSANAPQLWNSLPLTRLNISSTFKNQPKTYLFH